MSRQVVESSSLQGVGDVAPRRLDDSKTRRLIVAMMVIVTLSYGCRTTTPAIPTVAEVLRGVASWYGEEFAGRTTANGEIFDPAQLTAAHRTLPFGTVLDVTNPKTKQTVRVRVNDRGPYIGGRILDLSYAAAEKIGLIEPGIGEVEFALVRVGSGDREPPVPFESVVAVAPNTAPVAAAGDPPNVQPVPEAVVDRVEVQVERGGVPTRTQVGADGRTLEEVPIEGGAPIAPVVRTPVPTTRVRPAPLPASKKQFIVQVGAFSVEANARSLHERLTAIGQRAHIVRDDLYRVRMGPFATRDQAVEARSALEANGLSAIILNE